MWQEIIGIERRGRDWDMSQYFQIHMAPVESVFSYAHICVITLTAFYGPYFSKKFWHLNLVILNQLHALFLVLLKSKQLCLHSHMMCVKVKPLAGRRLAMNWRALNVEAMEACPALLAGRRERTAKKKKHAKTLQIGTCLKVNIIDNLIHLQSKQG